MNHDANHPRYRTRGRSAALVALLLACSAARAGDSAPVGDVEELLRGAELALERREPLAAASGFTAAAAASPDAALAERAAQFTFAAGFDALAEQTVERWLRLAPESSVARELLGRLKLRRHAVDEAAADLMIALGTGEPRRDEVYLALASDLATEDDAAAVTRVLSRLTAQDPLAPGLQLALGTAALRSGDYELALGAGSAAATDDPDWPEPQLLIARALAALGRDGEALATLAAIGGTLTASSPNPLVDIEYARLLADMGQVTEARQKLNALIEKFGDQPEISRTLALIDLVAGDLEAADRRFDDLDDSGPERFESFYYRAQIAAQRGDPEAALRLYGRISSGPYLVPAQLAAAESLVRAGAEEEALGQLIRFGQDHPALAFQVLRYRAQLLPLLKRPDDALGAYSEALQYKPAAVSVLLARGALFEQQGRLREALADLEAAAGLAPADAAAANALGYLLANRTGQSRKAWRYVRRAFEIQPRSAAIEDSLGWTLFKLGRHEEARSYLEEALRRLPDPEIASHLADVNWKLGDRDAATELLRSAAIAFPDSAPVVATASRLLN